MFYLKKRIKNKMKFKGQYIICSPNNNITFIAKCYNIGKKKRLKINQPFLLKKSIYNKEDLKDLLYGLKNPSIYYRFSYMYI